MKAYTAWVQDFVNESQHEHLPGRVPGWNSMQPESAEDSLLDYVMLRLRLADGIPVNALLERFGGQVLAAVEAGLELSTTKYAYRTEVAGQPHLRLSDPEGFLMSNDCISTVFAHLMSDADEPALTLNHA